MSITTEKPLLEIPDMVRALLESRKTETRQLDKLYKVNRSPEEWYLDKWDPDTGSTFFRSTREFRGIEGVCPYEVGQRRWVRETFWIEHDSDIDNHTSIDCGIWLKTDTWAKIRYCATDPDPVNEFGYYSKRPSIHMPRWASRITLEVTSRNPERLWDITEKEAIAEGIEVMTIPGGGTSYLAPQCGTRPPYWEYCARDAYMFHWDSRYAKRGLGWDVNPWVWRVGFKVLEVKTHDYNQRHLS